MYEVDVPVYFEVVRRQGYETRPVDVHVATFLKHADAKIVAEKQKDFNEPVGSVRPTFERGEGYADLGAYREYQRDRRDKMREEKLKEVNADRRRYGWYQFSSFEEMDKALYRGKLTDSLGYERLE